MYGIYSKLLVTYGGVTVSEVDLIILGRVKTEPSSAYEIQKNLEHRNVSHWVNVSPATIYKAVLRLEKKGYLVGKVIQENKMPEKTVYSITAAGDKHFYSAMKKLAKMPVRIIFSHNLAVVNMEHLSTEDAEEIIIDIRNEIVRTRAFLAKTLEERENLPLSRMTILLQQLSVANALDVWSRHYKTQFIKERGLITD